MSAGKDHRQEVTDEIIRLLEQGTAPWQKPWDASTSGRMPTNPTTGKAYRGGNAIYLFAVGLKRGYGDPRWMTYKQAREKDWQVRKGERGTQIEFWDVRKPVDGEDKGEEDAQKSRLIHRIYTVFNAQQIDGVPPLEAKPRAEFEVIEAGERILKHSAARIHHDQADRAFYDRKADDIHLPPKECFKETGGYYGTALHELAHWTGHPARLNRPTLTESYRFGDAQYAREELRAELASVFMAAEAGIPHDPSSHASYVASWIRALKDDKNEIFRASHDAAAAADYLLAHERERAAGDTELGIPEAPDGTHVQRLAARDTKTDIQHSLNL